MRLPPRTRSALKWTLTALAVVVAAVTVASHWWRLTLITNVVQPDVRAVVIDSGEITLHWTTYQPGARFMSANLSQRDQGNTRGWCWWPQYLAAPTVRMLFVPLWMPLAVTMLGACGFWWLHGARHIGCPRCGYSMLGLPDCAVCPECGGACSADRREVRGDTKAGWRSATLRWGCTAAAVTVAVVMVASYWLGLTLEVWKGASFGDHTSLRLDGGAVQLGTGVGFEAYGARGMSVRLGARPDDGAWTWWPYVLRTRDGDYWSVPLWMGLVVAGGAAARLWRSKPARQAGAAKAVSQ